MALILAHLATLQLSLCSKTLSGTFLLLFYIASALLFSESSHPLLHTYAHGGCDVSLWTLSEC